MKILGLIRICLLLFGLIHFGSIHAQTDWRLTIDDEWFKEYGIKGLQVGDTIPDISLGNILNNYTGKSRFSDFKGQLVILDFWNTACTDCIASFPKMEKLQSEFGEKIQVLLVNINESETEIKKAQAHYKIKIEFPNLPSIVRKEKGANNESGTREPSPLFKLFPLRGVPYHVYIGPDGTIEHAGPSSITYSKKVQDILDGKKIDYSYNGNMVPRLSSDKRMPFYKLLGNTRINSVQFGSFITRYTGFINGPIPMSHENLIDSASSTRRYTYLNAGIFYLFKVALFEKRINPDIYRNFLYGPAIWSNIILPQNFDTPCLFPEENRFDTEIMNLSYCYEQVVRLNISEEERLATMEADLNRYFKAEMGLEVHLETIKTAVYALIRTSGQDKLASTTKEKLPFYEYYKTRHIISKNKEKKYSWKGVELGACLAQLFDWSLKTEFIENKKVSRACMVFNETGWSQNKTIDIILPHQETIKSLEDIRKALIPYDLNIVQMEKEFQFLVFKKIK